MALEPPKESRYLVVESIEKLRNLCSVGWWPTLKRYVEEDRGLQVANHLWRDGAAGPRDPAKLRSALERTFRVEDKVQAVDTFWYSCNRRRPKKVFVPDVEDGQIDVSMLVDVPEVVQDCEWSIARIIHLLLNKGRILPPHERLQSLELWKETSVNSPKPFRRLDLPRDAVSILILLASIFGEDRERNISPFAADPRRRNVSLSNRELPDHVVQRGAEVVHNVADDDAPFRRGRPSARLAVDDHLSRFGVALGESPVGFAFL